MVVSVIHVTAIPEAAYTGNKNVVGKMARKCGCGHQPSHHQEKYDCLNWEKVLNGVINTLTSNAFLTAFLIGSIHEMCIFLVANKNQFSKHLGSLPTKNTIILTMSLIGLKHDTFFFFLYACKKCSKWSGFFSHYYLTM